MTKTIKLAAINSVRAIREDYQDTMQSYGLLNWKAENSTGLGFGEYGRLCFLDGMSRGLAAAIKHMEAEFSGVGVKL